MSTSSQRLSSRRARKKRNGWLIGGAVVGALAVLAALGLVQQSNLPGEKFASQGNLHLRDVDSPRGAYNSDPPTSGWHVGHLAGWDSYDYVLPDELLLHNLEDGGVVLYYTLGTAEENEAAMTALAEVARGFHRIIIAPREEMPTRYTLAAWQRLQRFDEIDTEGMRVFIEAYEGVDHH